MAVAVVVVPVVVTVVVATSVMAVAALGPFGNQCYIMIGGIYGSEVLP